jgi:hypothetical protein
MIRPALLGLLVCLCFFRPTFADPPKRDVSAVVGVQRAIAAAREHLRANRSTEAVAALEAELLNADGNITFLNLLHDAYTANLRDLQAQKADATAIDTVRRRLRALDGKAAADLGAPVAAKPDAADIRPPAPPIPDAPAELVAPTAAIGPSPESSAIGIVAPPVPGAAINAAEDPFQQKLRDESGTTSKLPLASKAFANRRFAEAAVLFAEASRGKESFSAAQRDESAYCQLHAIGMRLNKSTGPIADSSKMVQDVEAALQAGSERLKPFGNQLLSEIRRRGSAPEPVASDWQTIETANFRVCHRGQAAIAADIGQSAEAARKAMYERWAGSVANNWSSRCDIYLHTTAAEYAKATGKLADQVGHSTVGVKSSKVVSRRIDLRLDEPTLMDSVLPSEITQVVLADMFADQPLPRWAVVGMAALSESPEGVARYQRAVPPLLRDKKLFAVGAFLDQAAFPEPPAVTAFYAESVSLVAFLVQLKGSKAFATFLREAPRRGYARALTSHYGFKDPAELQDRWIKHVLGGE